MRLDRSNGLIDKAQFIESPNCDDREHCTEPDVIILHCISLPPGDYQSDSVIEFFSNQLDCSTHPYFLEIAELTVSSHFLIRRNGQLIQFVPTNKRAWHAGESLCLGRPKVNDFSIGIELEGLDTDPEGFTEEQYQSLETLVNCLMENYPKIDLNSLFAHSDIAPGRKSDPGPYFDWSRVIRRAEPR